MEQHFRITNYYEHPTNPIYTVFHFLKIEQCETFENFLTEGKIPYEKFVDTEGHATVYLFAVGNIHRKKAEHYNFLTLGKHREPFIPNKWLRWGLLLFALTLLVLALLGYYNSQLPVTK